MAGCGGHSRLGVTRRPVGISWRVPSQRSHILKDRFRIQLLLEVKSAQKSAQNKTKQEALTAANRLNAKMAVMTGNTNGVKAQDGSNKIKSKNQYKREKAKIKKQAAAVAPTPVSP